MPRSHRFGRDGKVGPGRGVRHRAKATEAKEAGAEIVGGEELVEEVLKGNIDFDATLATPGMMAVVGKAGRVLGPGASCRTRRPARSPRTSAGGRDIKGGRIEYKVDRTGNLHTIIGKRSFSEQQLLENYLAVVDEVLRAKPFRGEGKYAISATLAPTMGPAVRLDRGPGHRHQPTIAPGSDAAVANADARSVSQPSGSSSGSCEDAASRGSCGR